MGALYRIKDYLGPRGLAIAFKAFVRRACEYGNVFMGAASTHLSKLDGRKRLAERSSESTFPTLCSCCSASAMGLLCKMLASCCWDPLQPAFVATPVSHSYYLEFKWWSSAAIITSPPQLFGLFCRSFLGAIQCKSLWASTPSDIWLRGAMDRWLAILKLLQRTFCVINIVSCALWMLMYKKIHPVGHQFWQTG